VGVVDTINKENGLMEVVIKGMVMVMVIAAPPSLF
jgi:hypothetical protein